MVDGSIPHKMGEKNSLDYPILATSLLEFCTHLFTAKFRRFDNDISLVGGDAFAV